MHLVEQSKPLIVVSVLWSSMQVSRLQLTKGLERTNHKAESTNKLKVEFQIWDQRVMRVQKIICQMSIHLLCAVVTKSDVIS